MTSFSESDVEQTALDWLAGLRREEVESGLRLID